MFINCCKDHVWEMRGVCFCTVVEERNLIAGCCCNQTVHPCVRPVDSPWNLLYSPLNVGMGTSIILDGDGGVFFCFLFYYRFSPLTSSVQDAFNIRTVPGPESVWFCEGSCMIDWLGRSSHQHTNSPSAANVMWSFPWMRDLFLCPVVMASWWDCIRWKYWARKHGGHGIIVYHRLLHGFMKHYWFVSLLRQRKKHFSFLFHLFFNLSKPVKLNQC